VDRGFISPKLQEIAHQCWSNTRCVTETGAEHLAKKCDKNKREKEREKGERQRERGRESDHVKAKRPKSMHMRQLSHSG
jgi:hypothetical protein